MNGLNFWINFQNCMNNNANSAVCMTHIGKRTNHEDNFFLNGTYLTPDLQVQLLNRRCYSLSGAFTSKVQLYAVSDGMGGHNAGEVASRICVEKLAVAHKVLTSCSSLEEAVYFLQRSIAEINNTVCDMSRRQPEWRGMGATLLLLIIYGAECAILNVGDSRAYQFNGNQLTQITKDHTEGQRMLDLGLLTRKELAHFPARKNLNRYIGHKESGYILQADLYYPSLENSMFLLCSDGISDFISDMRMSEILGSESNLEIMGKQLLNEAVAASNADNATVILIPFRR